MAFSETRFGWVHLEQPSKHWQSMLCHHLAQGGDKSWSVWNGCLWVVIQIRIRRIIGDGHSSCITDFPVA